MALQNVQIKGTEEVSNLGIQGLRYIPNFIDQQTHDVLVRFIEEQKWNVSRVITRPTQHYGYRYDYSAKTATKDTIIGDGSLPLPIDLIADTCQQEGLSTKKPNQAIVNRYRQPVIAKKGNTPVVSIEKKILTELATNNLPPAKSAEGIGWHIDCEGCFTDTIITIRLQAAVVMDFRKIERSDTGRVRVPKPVETFSLVLEKNSALILEGEARFWWQHSIAKRKNDKIDEQITPRSLSDSITLRTMQFNHSEQSLQCAIEQHKPIT